MQGANFTNKTYMSSFVNYVFDIYYASFQQIPFIGLSTKGDQYLANGWGNYTLDSLVSDCDLINNAIWGLYMTGPGAT
jgi:hypothetical protein